MEQLREITATIKNITKRNKQPEYKEKITAIEGILVWIETNPESRDIVPQIWYEFLEQYFINTLWTPEFWKAANAKACYMFTKFERRFFPMQGSEEWTTLTKKVYKDKYPEFKDDIGHSNFSTNVDNLKTQTNYGMIPQIKTSDLAVEIAMACKIAHVALILADPRISTKLWYYLATNHELCHVLLKTEEGISLTKSLMKTDTQLVLGGLRWTMYMLSHEESTSRDPNTESRFVFTLDEINTLAFLNNLAVDVSPWIVNSLRYDQSIYQAMPFYLAGKRSAASSEQFHERLNYITMGCLAGIEEFKNVGIVGSILTECVINNQLLRRDSEFVSEFGALRIASRDTTDGDFDDMKAFNARSVKYFPGDDRKTDDGASMSSDLDIAISDTSFKTFMDTAYQVVAVLNHNIKQLHGGEPFHVVEDCTASGIRLHVSHPQFPRKIEIFRTPYTLMRLVASFHVACVRMYYSPCNRNVYATRGCVAAILTGVSENFQWFSTAKVPADVVLKYAQRGITTVLNKKEIDCLIEYLKTSPRWAYGYHNANEITGCFDWSNRFFQSKLGVRYGERTTTDNDSNNIVSTEFNNYTVSADPKYESVALKLYEDRDAVVRVLPPPKLF